MRRVLIAGVALLLSLPLAPAGAQFGFTTAFKPAEFAARRAKVMEQIGNGIAVIDGSAEIPGSLNFRQGNQFFYLTGVEVARSVLVIDGKAHSSTLFLPAHSDAVERNSGPMIFPSEATEKRTGIEHTIVRDSVFAVLTRLAKEGRDFYAPFGTEVRGASYSTHVSAYDKANAEDPLDGRKSREQMLVDKLKSLSGRDVKDLDPIVNKLRAIKSPVEIAAIREASRVAGLGLIAAMKMTKPGMYEYQLGAAADFEFRNAGAQGFGYGAIIGVDSNAIWQHYRLGQSKMAANQLVLMDYAPDINYYTSDVTRQWPVSGKFSPREREMYTIYALLFHAVESSFKVNTPIKDILKDAVAKMDKIMADYHFTDPKIKAAAEKFVTQYRNNTRGTFGHSVGMAVHDVSNPQGDMFTPGMIFALEPTLTIPDEKIYIRIENTYAVTDTAVENLSPEAPFMPDDIEKLMRDRRPNIVP